MMIRLSLIAGLVATCLCAAPVDQRMANVERGLTPRIRIEGDAETRWTIAERQKVHNVPGVSVAVINDGEVEWVKGYGEGVTPETRFQAASISKPVAAVTALRMVIRGELSLDEDVNKKLKSWKVPDNQWGKPVTLRGILSHTAGLTVHGFPGYTKTVPIPTLVQVLNGEKPANTAAIRVDVEPGSINRYSGGGYEVMHLLIEDVTGKPFPAVVKSLVLDPAGMKDSGYDQPPAGKAAPAFKGNGNPVPGGWHIYPEQAAAGLWTTPGDLARFLLAVKSSKLLPEAMTKEMLTPVKGGAGLGFAIDGEGDTRTFGHGGANEGYRCNSVAYLNRPQGAVVMTNGDNGASITGEILRAIAVEYGWPGQKQITRSIQPLSSEQLDRFVGEYEAFGSKVQITRNGRGLKFAAPPGTFEFLPESDSRFFSMSEGVPGLQFEKNAEGGVTGFRIGNVTGKKI